MSHWEIRCVESCCMNITNEDQEYTHELVDLAELILFHNS